MGVPNFDAPTAPAVEQPDPPRFRLLDREWVCLPTLSENALVAAQMGHCLSAFVDGFPEPAAAVLSDVALRFVTWSVVDADGFTGALLDRGPVDAATIINVMGWLVGEYQRIHTTPAPAAAPPVPSVPKSSLADLQTAIAKAGLPPSIIKAP